jgi:hypothetical protein
VLHTAEGALTIESLGGYFQGQVGASSHVGADDKANTVGEYVKRGNKAWTQASYNGVAVSMELCAFASWSTDEWNRHQNMLDNCAKWIAEECAFYGIPITKLSASQAQGSGRGICQHVDLGSSGGGHHDCGPGFPIDRVLDMARGGSSPEPTPPPAKKEGEMVASAQNAQGSFHVFVAEGDKVKVTWQNPGETDWHGGQPGKSIAGLSQFATAPGKVVGIDAALAKNGTLHVFIQCDNGKTYYTYQPKGKTVWNGGEAGKTVARFSLFAP